MTTFRAEPVLQVPISGLGESPCWDEKRACLHWVDIHRGSLNTWFPAGGERQQVQMPEAAGMVALADDGGLIVAQGCSIIHRSPQGVHRQLYTVDADNARLNDGKCDARGRLWIGTVCHDFAYKGAQFGCYDGTTWQVALPQVSISNGVAWSPENSTLYYIDSAEYTVEAFDFDVENGRIGGSRTCYQFAPALGLPDGLTVDREGFLWVALFCCEPEGGDGRVLRINPSQNEVVAEVLVPGAARVTSCTFGGANWDDLYITTAVDKLDEAALLQQPHAGRLFTASVDVQGWPPVPFAMPRTTFASEPLRVSQEFASSPFASSP